jgi:low affinity Fe/Cu permease
MWFDRLAERSAQLIGSSVAFLVLIGLTLAWLAIGPWAHWSEVWQITMTTALTVATQFTAMLIQATATRNERAMQAKLDELIRSCAAADNRLRGIEHEGLNGG